MSSFQGHGLVQFIDNVLIRGLSAMVNNGAGYLAFGQIAIGIEFLGSCKDELAFDAERQSKIRFALGITEYMAKIDQRYAAYNDALSPYYLYKHLRCGMAHLVRPQGKVVLTGDENFGLHLEKPPGVDAIVITLKPFFNHFVQACDLLKQDIPKLSHKKISEIYLPVAIISSEGPVFPPLFFPK